MRMNETEEQLSIDDYAWCLLFYGVIGMALSGYVLWQGDVLNGLILLVPTSVLAAYAKKRHIVFDKIQQTFSFTEQNLFGKRTIAGSWGNIKHIDVFHGRGRVSHPGGAVRIVLDDGRRFRIHENGKCGFSRLDTSVVRDRIKDYLS